MASINYFLVWKKHCALPFLVLQKPFTINEQILDQILKKSLTETDSSRILHLDSSFLIYIQIKFEVLYFCITDISYPINLASQFISRIESRLFDCYNTSIIHNPYLKIEPGHQLQFENLFEVYNNYQDPDTFKVLTNYKSKSNPIQFPSPIDYKSFTLPIKYFAEPNPPPPLPLSTEIEITSSPMPIIIKISILISLSIIILLILFLNYLDIT